jgi:hypothetical protein
MAIVKRRINLRAVSKSFPELVAGYGSTLEKTIEFLLESAIEEIQDSLVESKLDPITSSQNEEYFALVLKTYLPILFPKLYHRGSRIIDRAATQFAKETPAGDDLFAFCRAHQLDPISSPIRIVNNKLTFTEASLYCDWQGSLFEAFQGSTFTDINRRREFTIYLPGQRLAARPDLSLKVRNSAYRP